VTSPSDEHGGHDGAEGLGALDGPADEELEYFGPGHEADDAEPPVATSDLPGGVDHTTAAVGGGALGMVLLGIAGVFKRRWARRRYEALDE
jgi:hypothetical protein